MKKWLTRLVLVLLAVFVFWYFHNFYNWFEWFDKKPENKHLTEKVNCHFYKVIKVTEKRKGAIIEKHLTLELMEESAEKNRIVASPQNINYTILYSYAEKGDILGECILRPIEKTTAQK